MAFYEVTVQPEKVEYEYPGKPQKNHRQKSEKPAKDPSRPANAMSSRGMFGLAPLKFFGNLLHRSGRIFTRHQELSSFPSLPWEKSLSFRKPSHWYSISMCFQSHTLSESDSEFNLDSWATNPSLTRGKPCRTLSTCND